MPGYSYSPEYFFTDKNGHQKKASVRITCPDGLSASDEFYLWGLLALTISQTKPELNFFATPHYVLRQLGRIDQKASRGGKQYEMFRQALYRLATVTYRNNCFYDPLRSEHRDVGFGFLSYSLPLDPQSSRAWRFAWDPIFFEYCQAVSGALSFDMALYSQFDYGSRRLYLLLKKVFWRRDTSPAFDLRYLAVNVLGFSSDLPVWTLRTKVLRCVDTLLAAGILVLPEGAARASELVTKRGKGSYRILFHRGPLIDAPSQRATIATDSPHSDILQKLGLDQKSIRWVLHTFESRDIAECADMTLAKLESQGKKSFTSGPQAYFIDNLREIASGKRSWPDWWREMRVKEEQVRRTARPAPSTAEEDPNFEAAFTAYLNSEAKDAFSALVEQIFSQLTTAGRSPDEARDTAARLARGPFLNRFRAKHPL